MRRCLYRYRMDHLSCSKEGEETGKELVVWAWSTQDFIQDKELENDNDMSNPESKNAENCMYLLATQQASADLNSVKVGENNNGACAHTTSSPNETVQIENMKAAGSDVPLNHYNKKFYSELNSSITRIEVTMPEAKSMAVSVNKRGASRGKLELNQELNRNINKGRATESGSIMGPEIRPCREPVERQRGQTREVGMLKLKHSVVASTVTVKSHRRQQLEMVKKRLEEYGEPYLVGEYDKFLMTFDSGCPAGFV